MLRSTRRTSQRSRNHRSITKSTGVEGLERRLLMATVTQGGGVLTIRNQSGALTLAATDTNKFHVQDGAIDHGIFTITGGVLVIGTNADNAITVDMAGRSVSGGIAICAANGNDTVTFTDSVGGGSIGNVAIDTGLGNDTDNLNSTGTAALTFAGRITATDPTIAGADTLTLGNGAAPTTVGGAFATIGINNVNLEQGQNDVFGSSIGIAAGNKPALNVRQGLVGGTEVATVAASVLIIGGPLDDQIFLRGMVIGGDLAAALGESLSATPGAGNNFSLSSSAATQTVVNGNTFYSGGSKVDLVSLSGAVMNGNLSIGNGDGNDTIDLATFGANATVIGGDLAIVAGDGNITWTTIAAQIGGDVSITVGNGTNDVTFGSNSSVGGTLTWRSGSGGNTLTLLAPQVYTLDVIFGSGNDTFRVNNASAVLLGSVNGGAGTDTFDLIAGTTGPGFTQSNFP